MLLSDMDDEEIDVQPLLSSPFLRIQRIIGIMGSKGGVGKSTLTGLLAVELARAGYRVGILDADLTGSSIPILFGLHGPLQAGPYSFLPLQSESGIKVISADLFVEDDTQPFVWKNALAGKVIEQLVKEVEWGKLDFLLVDLPPATSEVTVSILQTIPFTGLVIVTQPQDLSVRITSKGVRMAQMLSVSILGIVENSAYYFDPIAAERQYLFGPSHLGAYTAFDRLPVLARLPFSPDFTALCDLGKIEKHAIPEARGLYEAFNASLVKIEAEKFVQSQSVTAGVEKVFPQPSSSPETEAAFSQTSHTGEAFSDTVIRLIQNKDNMGSFDYPDAQGLFMGKCGDRMQIDLQIVNGRILGAKFLAEGCGATLACGSMITKMACSKTIPEAEKITAEALIDALEGLPDDHLHCAELAVMTLREAVIDAKEGHRNKKR